MGPLQGPDVGVQFGAGFGGDGCQPRPFVKALPAARSEGQDKGVVGDDSTPTGGLDQEHHRPHDCGMGDDRLLRIAGLE